jgi:uncharacterized linocin/CFP29 family protein
MDLANFTKQQLIDILNGSNEVKAEFARRCMPLCETEDEFHQALREAIDTTPEDPA